MRVLTDKGVFAEQIPGTYSHTRTSIVICRPNQANLIRHRLDSPLRATYLADIF